MLMRARQSSSTSGMFRSRQRKLGVRPSPAASSSAWLWLLYFSPHRLTNVCVPPRLLGSML